MSDKKISALSLSSVPLAGTEVLPIVQGGSTVKVSVANLTAGRDVSMSGITVSGASLFGNAPQYNSAVVSMLGDGVNPTGFINTNGGTNATRYTALAVSTNNTAYSVKLQVARYTGSYDLGWAWRCVNSSGVEFEALQLDSSGNLVPTTAAKGVNFTANTPAAGMTSQLLNWYEQGTFTPVLNFGGATTGITYSYQVGRYTRIGNRVMFNFYIVLSSKGSATGNTTITSMPFVANASTTVTAFSVIFENVTTALQPLSQISGGNSIINVLVNNTGTPNNITDTSFTNTSRVMVSGQYEV